MKKVRKDDLIRLIAELYYDFLDPDHKPINNIIDGNGEIRIQIDSVCIRICGTVVGLGYFTELNVRDTKFAKVIEAITFGNLKVIYSDEDTIYIANSYEVIR